MILNAEFQSSQQLTTQSPIVLIHGLFGSLSNLGMIARKLNQNYDIIQMDLRNHGLSPHAANMDYELMAHDVIETLDRLNIKKFSLVGHSMGGKVSMKIAGLFPNRVDKLIILDVAPIAYQGERHEEMFLAIEAVQNSNEHNLSRTQASEIMRKYLDNEMIIQFLLKSFIKGEWLYNVSALKENYKNLVSWNPIDAWDKPCLFIRGSKSEYILPQYQKAIDSQFPLASIETVPDAGHWLHAENPNLVLSFIQDYLTKEVPSNV